MGITRKNGFVSFHCESSNIQFDRLDGSQK